MFGFGNRNKATAKPSAAASGKPDEKFEEAWKVIADNMEKLKDLIRTDGKSMPAAQLNMFRATAYAKVYDLCLNGATGAQPGQQGLQYPTLIYNRLNESMTQYVRTEISTRLAGKTADHLLMEVHEIYRAFKLLVKGIKLMFRYLDEAHAVQNKVPYVEVAMNKIFNQVVFADSKGALLTTTLSQITEKRNGNMINDAALRSIIQLYETMGQGDTLQNLDTYTNDFETPFINATRQYYERECATLLSNGPQHYLAKVDDRVKEEETIANTLLHAQTKPKLMEVLVKALIKQPGIKIVTDALCGCTALLSKGADEDLARMYFLFAMDKVEKNDLLDKMAEQVTTFVTEQGHILNREYSANDKADAAKKYVVDALALHDKYMKLVDQRFKGSAQFKKAVEKAFENFLNPKPKTENDLLQKGESVSSSELLAMYIDSLMKEREEGEGNSEGKIENIVQVFGYVNNKDMFLAFYSKFMAKRLLGGDSDVESERAFVSQLKIKQGNAFTSKLEGMILDTGNAKKFNDEFKANLSNPKYTLERTSLDIDFEFKVLTTGFWPKFKQDRLNLSVEMLACQRMYEQYYTKLHQNRKLNWIHSLATNITVGNWTKGGQKEMLLATFQALILYYLNQGPRSLDQLITATGLDEEDAKRVMHSLAYQPKCMVLIKCDENGKPEDAKSIKPSMKPERNHFYTVNEDFTYPKRKFKVPMAQVRDPKPIEDTMEARKHIVEAAIVRLMKSRQVLPHQELTTETMKQLSRLFQPDPKDIKKRVEDLIVRGYLERDPDDPTKFKYKA